MQTRAQVKSFTLKNNNRILLFIMFLLKCKINITRGLYFMVPSQLQGSGRLVDIPAMRLRSPGLLYDHSIVGSLFLEALPSVLRASCHCFSSYGSSHTHTSASLSLSHSFTHFSSPFHPPEEIDPMKGDTLLFLLSLSLPLHSSPSLLS